jgi:AMP-binding enzyme/AMP-binding enzyme C-terminal domain
MTTGFGSTKIGGAIARVDVDVDGTDLACCGRQAVDPRGYELRVVDEHDNEVGHGEVGELLVRTSMPWTLSTGYFRDGEATAAAWRNGWFHTGDAMRRSAEGDYYFVDRYKDCIRRKGENISSFEVEGYVMEHPSVAEAAAVGVPSEDGEQEIKVFVVPREPVDLAALGDWLAERTPRFMTPRYLETCPACPGHRRLDGCRSPTCAAGRPARPSGTAPLTPASFLKATRHDRDHHNDDGGSTERKGTSAQRARQSHAADLAGIWRTGVPQFDGSQRSFRRACGGDLRVGGRRPRPSPVRPHGGTSRRDLGHQVRDLGEGISR